MARHPRRQQWWWWALMGVVVVVAIVVGSGTAPKTGDSDERLFALAARLKCMQCAGESVAASQAPLAVQFRDEIRQQMRDGSTDDEILNYFADRYEGVLLTPPSTGVGALVWVLPVVVVAAALLLLGATFRRWRRERDAQGDGSASDEDRDLVAGALADRHARDRT